MIAPAFTPTTELVFNERQELIAVNVESRTVQGKFYRVPMIAHSEKEANAHACPCQAGENGRHCWHTDAALEAAKQHIENGGKYPYVPLTEEQRTRAFRAWSNHA